MRRIVLTLVSVFIAGYFINTATSAQAQIAPGELISEQRSNWGLKDQDPGTRTMGSFDSLGFALAEANGKVFAGGKFLNVTNGQNTGSQSYLAAFEVSSGKWDSSFDPDIGGTVLSLENSPDGALFVGGEIDTWNGSQVGAFVKIDPSTGDIWPGWNTRVYGGTSAVRDISLEPDGWLYVSGSFTTASDNNNPGPVYNIIRLNPETGAIDNTWTPNLTDQKMQSIWGVSSSRTSDVVYVAGWVDSLNQADYKNAALGLDANTGSVVWNGATLNREGGRRMYDVEATEFGTVMFVGEEHGAYLYDENNDMELIIHHGTSYNTDYQDSVTRRGGDYQDIQRIGDQLFATCHCWGSHSTSDQLIEFTVLGWNLNLHPHAEHTGSVNGVIAYNARTGVRDQSFNPYMSGDIGGWSTLGASDGCLWVTGGFNAVGDPGNQRPGRDLVRLCDANGGTPVGVVAPTSCKAVISGGSVSISWDDVAAVDGYVVYRSVEGGSPFWRGVSSTSSFIDTNRDAELSYFVLSRRGAEKSIRTECDTEVEIPDPGAGPIAPAACNFEVSGDSVEVSWSSTNNAAGYVVYRNVNGGNQFWRGVTNGGLEFIDSNRDAELQYFVLAKYPDRTRSEKTECSQGAGDPPPPPVVIPAVASCDVTLDPQNLNSAIVSWPSVAENSAEYIVFRSVSGSNQFWRGKVSGDMFVDTLRSGSISYFVDVKIGNNKSERVTCSPTVEGQ